MARLMLPVFLSGSSPCVHAQTGCLLILAARDGLSWLQAAEPWQYSLLGRQCVAAVTLGTIFILLHLQGGLFLLFMMAVRKRPDLTEHTELTSSLLA